MTANRMWASALIRNRRAATLLLALFAGVAGGAVMTAAGVARRTSTVVERYLHQPDLASHIVIACPVGMTEDQIGGDPGTVCGKVDDVLVVADALRRSPAVERAVPSAVLVTGLRAGSAESWSPTIHYALIGDWNGVPNTRVVSGRVPSVDAPDEAAVNEALAARLDLTVGDRIDVATYAVSQRLDAVSAGAASIPAGVVASIEVVGVTRAVDDIAPDPEPTIFTTAGWWQRYGSDDVAGYGKGVALQLVDRDSDVGLEVAIRDALPGRLFDVSNNIASIDSTRRIIELQAGAAWAVALVALAALVGFVGLALWRQVDHDLTDRRTLVALGMTRSNLARGLGLRMAPVAAGASIVAVMTTLIGSLIGPVGLGRQVEVAPGLRADVLVLVVGCLGLVALIIGVPLLVLVAGGRWQMVSARRAMPTPAAMPAVVRAGVGFLRSGGQSSSAGAVIGTAVAIAAGIVAISLGDSHAALATHPTRFGQNWDVTLGDFGSPEEAAEGLRAIDGVEGVAGVGRVRSAEATVDGDPWFIEAFVDPDGIVGPTLLEGRLPADDDEIAVGTTSLRLHHLQLGDLMTVTSSIDGEQLGPLTIVGRVAINDGVDLEQSPGDGALVTDAAFEAVDPNSVGQSLLIRAATEVAPTDLVDRLQAAFGGSVHVAGRPEDIANLDRVSGAPKVVAGLVATLAATAFVNAVLTLLRRRRREVAILRALGFTRHQVLGTTLTVAATLAIQAALIGVPLGLLASRRGWVTVERRLGVESGAVVSVPAVVAVALATFLLAQLIALFPGIRAARRHPARALAVE